MHAFVTGAGRGLGRAIARRLAADGYALTLAGRTEAHLRETARLLGGATAFIVPCDVAVRADVDRAVAEAERALGPIDVLVNNAGVSESAPFASMTDELWERTIATNLTGTYHCMRAIAPGMFARQHGRIINIASSAAKVGYPYTAAYVASKHGVLGLTRAVALEAAPRGVTVNAICPGWIETDMTAQSVARIAAKTGRSAEEAVRVIAAMNPQGRLLQPDEIADVVAQLASPAAAARNGEAIDL